MIIHSKKLLTAKTKNPVEIVGIFPGDFSDTSYTLMKRGNYFYAIANTGAKYDENSTDVKKLNFIAKSTDLRNWIGSGIGSGRTNYDAKSDSFYSITFGSDYNVNPDNAKIAYHVTKINPDTFAYTNTTVEKFTMAGNSRGISQVQRVGSALMFLGYKNSHNSVIYYSYDSGATWKSFAATSVNSFVASAYSIYLVGNGSIAIAYGFLSSAAEYETLCFLAPNSYGKDVNDYFCGSPSNPCGTASDLTYEVDYSNNKFYLSSTLTEITKTINLPSKFITTSTTPKCAFYNNYVFMGYDERYYGTSPTPSSLGYIRIIDTNTGYCYLFDYGYPPYPINAAYPYSYLKSVLGIFDNYLYFHSTVKSSIGTIFRVPVDYVLKNMTRFYGE